MTAERQAPARGAPIALGFVGAVGLLGMLAVGLPRPEKPLKPSDTAEGRRFAVATENEDASKIALEVLRQGGNAVDAAAAAAFALGVATPTACGLGGGGFAVVYWRKTGEIFVLDFRETAPAAVDADAIDKRASLPPAKRGVMIGVPGEVQGLHQLLTKFGSRTWAQAIAPAADLARKGTPVTMQVARVAKWVDDRMHLRAISPELAALYLGPSGVLPIGTMVRRPQLAATLDTLAAQGPGALYQGPIAQAIVEASRSIGGTLTMADLAAYRTYERTPLRMKIDAGGKPREVVTMPSPSAGGLMLLEALRADEIARNKAGKGLTQESWGTGAYVHRMAEIMRGAFDDRAHYIGDPLLVKTDVEALLASTRLEKRFSTFDPWKTHSIAQLHLEEHGTSHISIIDADGNAVALTTTVNTPFGAKVVAGETGIVLNDELDDFSKPDDAPIARELAPNLPKPGARPTSSMTPTIVLEDGAVRFIVGGSGGKLITSSVTAVSVAALLFDIAPIDAIRAPRFHPNDKGLLVEGTMDQALREDLKKRGENVLEWKDWVNAVTAISVDARGTMHAAGDARKGGIALAE